MGVHMGPRPHADKQRRHAASQSQLSRQGQADGRTLIPCPPGAHAAKGSLYYNIGIIYMEY